MALIDRSSTGPAADAAFDSIASILPAMEARACIIFDGLIAESLGWACLLSVRAFARSGDRARARDDNALDAPLHQSFEPAQAQAGNSRDARRLLKLWRSSHGRWPRGLAFSTRGCGGGGCLDHRVNLSRNAPLLVLDRQGQPLPALLETLTTTALLKHTQKHTGGAGSSSKQRRAAAAAASKEGRRAAAAAAAFHPPLLSALTRGEGTYT